MKEIPLTQGKVALVDDEDFEELSRYKWAANNTDGSRYYAIRSSSIKSPGGKHKISMHRFLVDAPSGMCVDHVDGDGLNNQRANLRVCSQAENTRNQGKRRDNTSGFKGVYFHKRDLKWHARIKTNGTQISLGYHNTPGEAYRAYCEAAKKYHGDFAHF